MNKIQILPNFFKKGHIPEKLNSELQIVINKILKTAKNKEDCLKKAYAIITKKYQGSRLLTYLLLPKLITVNPNKLWNQSGFLHCTNFTYLVRILLVKSGFFTEEDIKLKWTTCFLVSPHQYLEVKLSKNKCINVDAWGHRYGVKLGNYSHGFNDFNINELIFVKAIKEITSIISNTLKF